MKKITSILLVVALLCCSVLMFASCDGDDHTHSYGSWSVSSNATCTTPGSKTKSCSCGDVITDTIPATGHNMVGGVCTECGATE